MTEQVLDFIRSNWDSCIKENQEGDDTLIGLPYPYTVPAVGYFDEMFYWDTYFTNLGLMLDGRSLQAKNNTGNIAWLIRRYGYMPNGNRLHFLSRSQPPFFSQMVRKVYDKVPDILWLREMYSALETEYVFWAGHRGSALGLSRYGCTLDPTLEGYIAQDYRNRTGLTPPLSDHELSLHYMATAESGWDINPRWGFECQNYATVELNSLLFLLEENMAHFAAQLQNGEAQLWSARAAARKKTMQTHMRTPDGLLMDCHIGTGAHSTILSAAAFFPLYVGLDDEAHTAALLQQLHRLEAPHGILTCEKNNVPGAYQWGYPNGWACLQYIAMAGLHRSGHTEDARRVAEKYARLVEQVYAQTGNLWEKYNVVEGNIQVTNEYGLPPMMGWSAGVYLATLHYLQTGEL